MAQIDWTKEHQRLTALYAAMETGELQDIAAHPELLTDVARQVLRSEASRRGMGPILETSISSAKQADPPVMIRRCQDLSEAMLSKSILDSAGIESFLTDENLVRINSFYSRVIGGMRLLVRGEDAETAKQLLGQETLEKFDVDGVGEYQQPRCPRCHSLDASFDELDKRVAYEGVLFAGVPVPTLNEYWKCNSCGNKWEQHSHPAKP
jgi:hypothetical protein